MLKDFDELKRQLSELSDVINKFSSEAVQLRIVDHVFGAEAIIRIDADINGAQPDSGIDDRKKSTRSAKKTPSTKASKSSANGRKSQASAKGAVAILNDLVDGDFFKSNKTINDIVGHCDQSLARRFSASAFSGALARLTRNGVLERQKNADGQYEYIKK